jgi:hypothetical protein
VSNKAKVGQVFLDLGLQERLRTQVLSWRPILNQEIQKLFQNLFCRQDHILASDVFLGI